MPAPIAVELVRYSPEWAKQAAAEAGRLTSALGDVLLIVHHIGSTSIPDIVAKPVLDLVPEVTSLDALDAARDGVVGLGYEWWGEYGIAGRRFCTLTDAATGKRWVQLHCFATGSPHIGRHLAFRDYMRRHPEKARAYEAEKIRARGLSPEDSHTYSAAKSAWIVAAEAEAMAEWQTATQP
jgi:GrpB-like predicted nucleotidyltransferase (UPF0157 family)